MSGMAVDLSALPGTGIDVFATLAVGTPARNGFVQPAGGNIAVNGRFRVCDAVIYYTLGWREQ